jgi:hypothetical protein
MKCSKELAPQRGSHIQNPMYTRMHKSFPYLQYPEMFQPPNLRRNWSRQLVIVEIPTVEYFNYSLGLRIY